MADSTTELKQLLLRYIYEYKGIDRLREVLQTTSVEDRYKALMSVRGYRQETAVHKGARRNDMDSIKYMMAGFTSNQQYNVLSVLSSYNCTALHYTAYYNSDTAIVMYLLSNLSIQQRYNILRIQDNDGDTALHYAASKKHNSGLQVMLSSVTPDQQKLLLNIKNKISTIADITSLPELPYDIPAWTRLELDELKERFKQQETVTSRQAEELNSAKEELNSTKEQLASTKEELTAVKESHEQQKAVIAIQADALEDSAKLVKSNSKQIEELMKKNNQIERESQERAEALEETNKVVAASSKQIEELVENNNQLEKDKNQQAQELYSAKEELNSTKEGLASTKEELTAVKECHEQQKAVVARQADAFDETNKVVAASSKKIEELVEKNNQLEKDKNQQAHALIQVMTDLGEQKKLVERETNQRVEELSALKETHEAVVAGQDAELQQLRYNQTEMLRMIEALEISLGKPTSDQENEW